jgi:hypothetical protein
MLSEIGIWRRHENSVRFIGSGQREEGAISPFSVVADTNRHYAVRGGLNTFQRRSALRPSE